MSFMKKGWRQSMFDKNQQHKLEFYRIIEEMEEVAERVYEEHKDAEFTTEWVEEVAPNYTDRKVELMETVVILGKLYELRERDTGATSGSTESDV